MNSFESEEDVVLDFGSENDVTTRKKYRRPLVVLFHLAFRSLALITYLFSTWFSSSFITPFVFIILFLSLDFWTVKNISGRLLVGLRWWNYVDDDGKSHWMFEQAKTPSNASFRKYSSQEVRVFWIALVVFPVLWTFLFFTTLVSFSFRWLMVDVLALGMNSANLYGYLRCKFGAHAKIRDVATKFVGQKIMENMFTSRGGGSGGADASSEGTARGQPAPSPGFVTMDGKIENV